MSNKNARYSFDSAQFIERLKLIIGDTPVRRFSRTVGISDTLIRNYLSGSMPSVEKAADIANGADVDFSWLCFGIGDAPDFISSKNLDLSRNQSAASEPATPDNSFTLIDSYAIYASAGHGSEIGHELQTEPMSFRTDWLRKEGFSPERLAVIRAKGDSMEPTISDNDVILVLLANGDAPRDGLHVIRLDGGLFVKRLQFDPLGAVHVKSDNPAYSSTLISKDERSQLHVVGRVVWAGKKF
ncbi:S24 family peptidase [uncultured Tolumonas sp.]|uniref:S24 family peptidase n=1 Tax=uncultured Tolumonas sp. TaxID=263765 RepID=UPI00293049E5|nr:S24 family peptidase [uncultured Tolumonas sp.]